MNRDRISVDVSTFNSHVVAEFRVTLDEVLVVAGPPIRTLGNALESPQIQASLKGLVLLASEVTWHNLGAEFFLVVDLKAVPTREPRDNGCLAVLFCQVEHLVEFPWELK